MGRLLTLSEVSEKTGIGVNTLRWLRQQGRGPRMGVVAGRLRAKEDDVDAWVEAELAATSNPGSAA